jgi:hypothetical protein
VQQPDSTYTGTVTTQDLVSAPSTQANGQVVYSGTPTTGSAFALALSSVETVMVVVTGTWTGTLQVEIFSAQSQGWIAHSVHLIGGEIFTSSFTQNFQGSLNTAAKTMIRVRATAAMTGTANVAFTTSDNPSSIYVANSIKLIDASTTISPASLTIKPASTPSTAADTAAVVAVSPGTPIGTKTPLSGNAPGSFTATTSSSQMLAANSSRHGLVVTNLGAGTVYFGLGATAVIGSGIALLPGGVWVMDEYTFSQAAINAIGTISSALALQELQ